MQRSCWWISFVLHPLFFMRSMRFDDDDERQFELHDERHWKNKTKGQWGMRTQHQKWNQMFRGGCSFFSCPPSFFLSVYLNTWIASHVFNYSNHFSIALMPIFDFLFRTFRSSWPAGQERQTRSEGWRRRTRSCGKKNIKNEILKILSISVLHDLWRVMLLAI